MSNSMRLIPAERLRDLPPTEILGGTRFIARGLNVVFGASGAFKSFYTLAAALAIAQTDPIVYVAAEGSGGLFKRVSAWCEYNQCTAGQAYFICEEVNLLDPVHIKTLVSLCKPIKPTMVTFDTLARCIPGGDENSAKDMGLAVRNSAIIQRDLATAITWIHHTNRAERGERGSGAIRGAADTMIELSANGDSVIRVSCSKLKDDEPWLTEEMKFQTVGASGLLIPADGLGSKLTAQEVQILDFLNFDVFDTSGAKAMQIGNALNIPERNIYRLLSHLKRELHISHDSKGDPYRLTEQGKSYLRKSSAKSNNVISLVKSGTSEATATTANDLQDFDVM